MLSIDTEILNINKVICRHIGSTNFSSRGAISQDILSQLRNFLEHIMLKFYANGEDIEDTYSNICDSIEYVKTRGDIKVLYKFHDYLQIVSSHYTLDEENSERLMLKYYLFLLKVKILLHDRYALEVLENLDKFPLHTDPTLQEYYTKIADKINTHEHRKTEKSEKYYIQKIKPFFCDSRIYYEVTFTPANDYSSKFDRVIAFTKLEITDYYAVKLELEFENIVILGKTMPIVIITDWEVAIRDCEYKNFTSLIRGVKIATGYSEQQGISRFLTSTVFSLSNLMDFSETKFQEVRQVATQRSRATVFFDDLDSCRQIVRAKKDGANLLRYLLYHMNNKIIKNQMGWEKNTNLSNLYFQNGCIPFDTMPFINSPLGHNPKLRNLFECISIEGRQHELLARFIKNNTEISGNLFTIIRDISEFDNIDTLAQTYNDKLWSGHRAYSKLVIENGQIFINGYKNDTCNIIEKLKDLAKSGVQNYSNTVNAWLNSPNNGVDSDEKKAAMVKIFENSHVALIYGSAGTGKSTLINHVAHFFASYKKLFLAQTNPAVDNLKHRVSASNCDFSTIASFLWSRNAQQTEYDLLIVDECSTVSNKDMRNLLAKATFKLLLLVGDSYQIASIRFGNWFSLARSFVPKTSVFELTKPYRSNNQGLITLWERVRNMSDTVLEVIARQNYSVTLDASIFAPAEDDEIILCLNYDGLYGINNINRFLQESNPSHPVRWGIQKYKVGDPVLFNESERFAPIIYNNTKGRITGIEILDSGSVSERIQFDIKLDKVINGLDAAGCDFELLENSVSGNSVIRFSVNKTKSVDDDDDATSKSVIPFQIAYAVSIHKAQGLEYGSVKIVITEEVDELITHNIFYTAITRAQKKLKIYWTPEVEQEVLTSIAPKDNRKDLGLMRKYIK